MFLYRVEAEDGHGPWCDAKGDWDNGKGTSWCMGAVSVHHAAHKVAVNNRNMRWGFSSMEQLFVYMLGDYAAMGLPTIQRCLEVMRASGLGISVFERNYAEVVGDHTQIVFNRGETKRIAWLQPDDPYIIRAAELYVAHYAEMRALKQRHS